MTKPINKKSRTRTISANDKPVTKSKTQKGGRTVVNRPSIKYEKGQAASKKLDCMKCNASSFIVKTLTMGTNSKAIFSVSVLDNRFKVFTCTNCGFVQIYSNEIKCSGKQCDPMF